MDNVSKIIELLREAVGNNSENPILSFIANTALTIIIVLLLIIFIMDFLTRFSQLSQATGKSLKGLNIFKKKAITKDDIKNRIIFDKKMQTVLQYFVNKHKISRAMLFQFHNGMNAKSGMPFEYLVLTHEATAKGVANSNLSNKHHDIRIFYDMISVVIDDKVYRTNKENSSKALYEMMENDGAGSLCAHIITDVCDNDLNSTAIGFIVLASYKEDLADESNVTDLDMFEIANRCSGILGTSYGKCDFCKQKKDCKHIKNAEETMQICSDYVP